jgi:hypothetical protein
MTIRFLRFGASLLVLSTMFLLQACADLDAGLKKAVVIKYAHIANVHQFQGSPDNGNRQWLIGGVAPGSFWAIFEVCSLDVQGSSLAGMQYDTRKFVADAGSGTYGPLDPGVVNAAGNALPSDNAQVLAALRSTFALGTDSQYFPRGFYPRLNSRIAIFVKAAPVGYHGEDLVLHYNGQPEVAAIVQNAGVDSHADIPFYLSGSSWLGKNACP